MRRALLQRAFRLVRHWEEAGIEIWTYQLESETLQISEEYGEFYVKGPDTLGNWLLSETQRE
jgi:hypothetical protein